MTTNGQTQTPGDTAESTGAAVAAPGTAAPVLDIPDAISVGDLAALMHVTAVDVIKQLMRRGHMYAINEVIDFELAADLAEDFGYDILEPEETSEDATSIVPSQEGEDPADLKPRPAVVTILGHVDHGKTTLLDAIRNTKVVEGEAGGITQHIGAYQIERDDSTITFLDTPGHEAFTAMRARGAKVTDIAVLVVAADDGLMPQTEEAIDHIKAADVPMIVAINKVDKADADPEKVKRQLAERDLLVEDWGGDIISVPVSALKGEGVSDVLEHIGLVAEISELKANPDRPARGVVVEAQVDRSRGPVATVLVQTGTLRVGDHIVVGSIRGRVKAMMDERGQRFSEAGPSTPAEVLGISGMPDAGDIFEVVADEKTGRALAEKREREAGSQAGTSLGDVYTRVESGEAKALNLIVRTDVQGSVEAVLSALDGLSTEKVKVNVIRSAAGGISENDVLLAVASDAIIIGFNTEPQAGARSRASQEGVEIRSYDVIYALIEDIENALKGLLEPVFRDVVEGEATVRAVFPMGRTARIAGFFVGSGKITRDAEVYVTRDGERLATGKLLSLKHFKNDVREVANGNEGGLVLDGFNDFQEGDILEAHRTEQVGVG
jgi:translation initiation factor IF-2